MEKSGTSASYSYDINGVRSSKTVGSTTYNFTTLSGLVMRMTWGSQTMDFIYDENHQPFAMVYKSSASATPVTYYYILNVQGDVMKLVDRYANAVATYTYDPWGKVLTSSGTMANLNPLRYRGYFYDSETNFYYLQSRYYDPAIGRFINADTFATTDINGLLSTNMFAYCENNPVMGVDYNGDFFETIFDVVSLGMSIVEVAVNPADPWAWAGLAGDIADLVPFVTGIGETVRSVKCTSKIITDASDVISAASKTKKSIKKSTGSYEIIFSSGKNYVGKGSLDRAIISAKQHIKPNKLNGYKGDAVESIIWKSAKNDKKAFIDESIMQLKRGVNNEKTYNLIWGPGKKLCGR